MRFLVHLFELIPGEDVTEKRQVNSQVFRNITDAGNGSEIRYTIGRLFTVLHRNTSC